MGEGYIIKGDSELGFFISFTDQDILNSRIGELLHDRNLTTRDAQQVLVDIAEQIEANQIQPFEAASSHDAKALAAYVVEVARVSGSPKDDSIVKLGQIGQIYHLNADTIQANKDLAWLKVHEHALSIEFDALTEVNIDNTNSPPLENPELTRSDPKATAGEVLPAGLSARTNEELEEIMRTYESQLEKTRLESGYLRDITKVLEESIKMLSPEKTRVGSFL